MAENLAKEVEANQDADGGAGKKGKKKLFILIGILVLVAGGGGGAAFFLLKGKKAEPEPDGHAEAAAGNEHGEKKTDHADKPEGENAHGENAHGEKPHGEKAGTEDPHAKEGAAATHPEKKEPAPGPSPGFGETYAFKAFHLNLGNPLENRYVRLEISTEYKGGEEQKKEIEARLPQLRDAIISVIQTKTREFILSPTGKDRLRYEITTQLNQLMTKKIENVYITDLIIE